MRTKVTILDRGYGDVQWRADVRAAVRCACLVVVSLCLGTGCRRESERSTPGPAETGPGVVRVEGSPEELGRQHGTLLRGRIHTMLAEYVGDAVL